MGFTNEAPKEPAYPTSRADTVYKAVVSFEQGGWHGPMVMYWKSGKKRREVTYNRGRQEGEYRLHYNDGTLQMVASCVDGVRQGRQVVYYKGGEGKIQAEFWLVDDLREGEALLRYESGALRAKGTFVQNGIVGDFVTYYETGEVNSETAFTDGVKHGTSVWYSKDGSIKDEDVYEAGECVELCEGDER